MNASTLAHPLCIVGDFINNPSGCQEAQGILGYTYKDNNADCLYTTVDSTKRNVKEQLYDGTSTLISQTFSAMNGVYDFPEPAGTYTVRIDTSAVPYTVQCVHPGIDSTTTLTAAVPLQTSVNFPITCKPGFDVGVQSVVHSGLVFPGQPTTLRLVAGDISNWYGLHCASGVSGQVIITVTGPVTFNSITAGALTPVIVGNVYTYNIANFGTINSSTAFGLVFTTNSTAVGGDFICVNVSVTPTAGDNNTSNNTYHTCYSVVNSYDPNYKETFPEYVAPLYDDYFTYTIHFQNTGTAAANNIHLQDTLDANLDVNTFQVINYSHYNTTWLTGNKLSFNFPNINLPDSTSDFNGSQGFVQYRIKPIAGLPAGTFIHNKASIYFDYNAPVVTNTTTNEYLLTVSNGQLTMDNGQLIISPNPATSTFTITSTDKIESIKIYNVLGEIVWQNTYHNITTATIDFTSNISSPSGRSGGAGIYFAEIKTEKGVVRKKIVKE